MLFFLFLNIVAHDLVFLCSLLLMLSGDIEINPGPLFNCKEYFSICHWNLNSMSAHDYSILFLSKAYIKLHKCDIICSSETYLDSATPTDVDTLIHCDHPSNTKCGGVYYKVLYH